MPHPCIPQLPRALPTQRMMVCAQRVPGEQAPSWDRLSQALVLFRLVLSCVLELWSPLLILTQTWECKRHRRFFCEQKAFGDYSMLVQLRESC